VVAPAAITADAPILVEDRTLPPDEQGQTLLEIKGLVKEFPVTSGIMQRSIGSVKAVSGVSFSVQAGETFGLVGESGCGKTTIGRMIVALERPTAGEVTLHGTNISK